MAYTPGPDEGYGDFGAAFQAVTGQTQSQYRQTHGSVPSNVFGNAISGFTDFLTSDALFGFAPSDLLMGAGGLFFGGLPTAAAALFGGQALRGQAEANEQAQSLTDAVLGVGESARLERERLEQRFPTFQSQGRIFGGPQGYAGMSVSDFNRSKLEGLNAINLDEIFDTGQRQLDFFRENEPPTGLDAPLDFSGAQTFLGEGQTTLANLPGLAIEQMDDSAAAIADLFDDPDARSRFTSADFLEGVEFPDTDLSAVQASRLAGADAASMARETLAQAQLSAQAGSFGGLENMRRTSSGLSFGEAQSRGLESSGIVAQTRAEELAAQQIVSGLQANAAGMAGNVNRDLLLAQAADLSGSGRQAAQSIMNAGLSSANLSTEQGRTEIERVLAQLGVDVTDLANQRSDFYNELNVIGQTGNDDIGNLTTLLSQLGLQTQTSGQLGAQDLSATLGSLGILAPQIQQQQFDPVAFITGIRNFMFPQSGFPSVNTPSSTLGIQFDPGDFVGGFF